MERLSVEEPLQASQLIQRQERKRSKSLTDWALKTFSSGSDIFYFHKKKVQIKVDINHQPLQDFEMNIEIIEGSD